MIEISNKNCNHETQHCSLRDQYDVDTQLEPPCSPAQPHIVSPRDLSDLTCDLNLPKNQQTLGLQSVILESLRKRHCNISVLLGSEGLIVLFLSGRQLIVL
jgi:hypothetical protein